MVRMPAPSGMFGRNITPEQLQRGLSDYPRTSGGTINIGVTPPSSGNGNSLLRITPEVLNTNSPQTPQRLYDETYTSNPVTEVKRMLWEIQDFHMTFTSRVERAMTFEFDVGRLGSMERHLPRRSRWKIVFDVEDPCRRIPALRVVQLSPENKTIFYKLEACILEGGEAVPERETEFKILVGEYKEGSSDPSSPDNLFPFRSTATAVGLAVGGRDFLDQIQDYLHNGSIFVKVRMEILEDSSTPS